jgi:hypothetical protein
MADITPPRTSTGSAAGNHTTTTTEATETNNTRNTSQREEAPCAPVLTHNTTDTGQSSQKQESSGNAPVKAHYHHTRNHGLPHATTGGGRGLSDVPGDSERIAIRTT